MNRLHWVVAMFFLALWLPATSLCLIERAGWLEDDCCPSASQESAPAPCSGESTCCALASATFKLTEEHQTLVLPALVLAPFAFSFLQAFEPPAPQLVAPDFPAPELPRPWQFSLRSALPPRAPSLSA